MGTIEGARWTIDHKGEGDPPGRWQKNKGGEAPSWKFLNQGAIPPSSRDSPSECSWRVAKNNTMSVNRIAMIAIGKIKTIEDHVG